MNKMMNGKGNGMKIIHREHRATRDELSAAQYATTGTGYWKASLSRGYYDGKLDLKVHRWDGDEWKLVYVPLVNDGYRLMKYRPNSNPAAVSSTWVAAAYEDADDLMLTAFSLIGEVVAAA